MNGPPSQEDSQSYGHYTEPKHVKRNSQYYSVQNSVKGSMMGLPPAGSGKPGKRRIDKAVTSVPSHDGTVLVEDYEDNEDPSLIFT
jgi:hypothetical protein